MLIAVVTMSSVTAGGVSVGASVTAEGLSVEASVTLGGLSVEAVVQELMLKHIKARSKRSIPPPVAGHPLGFWTPTTTIIPIRAFYLSCFLSVWLPFSGYCLYSIIC
jgi:hypothetical protein